MNQETYGAPELMKYDPKTWYNLDAEVSKKFSGRGVSKWDVYESIFVVLFNIKHDDWAKSHQEPYRTIYSLIYDIDKYAKAHSKIITFDDLLRVAKMMINDILYQELLNLKNTNAISTSYPSFQISNPSSQTPNPSFQISNPSFQISNPSSQNSNPSSQISTPAIMDSSNPSSQTRTTAWWNNIQSQLTNEIEQDVSIAGQVLQHIFYDIAIGCIGFNLVSRASWSLSDSGNLAYIISEIQRLANQYEPKDMHMDMNRLLAVLRGMAPRSKTAAKMVTLIEKSI
jgi:hypothetical protein